MAGIFPSSLQLEAVIILLLSFGFPLAVSTSTSSEGIKGITCFNCYNPYQCAKTTATIKCKSTGARTPHEEGTICYERQYGGVVIDRGCTMEPRDDGECRVNKKGRMKWVICYCSTDYCNMNMGIPMRRARISPRDVVIAENMNMNETLPRAPVPVGMTAESGATAAAAASNMNYRGNGNLIMDTINYFTGLDVPIEFVVAVVLVFLAGLVWEVWRNRRRPPGAALM